MLSEKLENSTLFTTFWQPWFAEPALNKRKGLAGTRFVTDDGHGPIEIERGSRGIQQGAAADRAIQDRPDEPGEPNGEPPGDPPTSMT